MPRSWFQETDGAEARVAMPKQLRGLELFGDDFRESERVILIPAR